MGSDSSFGPQWGTSFDLTITFENWFLTVLPACILILITAIYTTHYLKQPVACLSGPLLWSKLAAGIFLVCVEIAVSVVWGLSSDFPAPSSIVVSCLSCIAALCTVTMAGLGHRFAIQSSMLFSIYLTIAFVLEMARSRSFLLRDGLQAVGALTIIGTVLRFALMILEEIPKPLVKTLTDDYSDEEMSQEATGGFWNRTLLVWLTPTLLHGFKQNLEMEDLAPLGPAFSAEKLSNRFESAWINADKTSKHCLAKTTFRVLSFEFLVPAVPRLCQSAFQFTLPWLMERVLSFVQDSEHRNPANGGGLLGATAIIYFGNALSKTSYKHLVNRLAVQIRGMLVGRVLKKNISLGYSTAKGAAALTIMGTDVDSAITNTEQAHDVWISLLEIAAGLYLLSRRVGHAFFLPIATITLCFIISSKFSSLIVPASAGWNKAIQTRVSKMKVLVTQMKAIKMIGLDDTVLNYVRKLRSDEIKKSLPVRWVYVGIIALLPLNLSFTPAILLAGALFWTTFKQGLDSVRLYPVLVLLTLIGDALMLILQTTPQLGTAAACFERVGDFLLLDERVDPRHLHLSDDCASSDSGSCEKTFTAYTKVKGAKLHVINIRGANIAAAKDADPVLKNVNLTVSESGLFMAVGAVGSGKSVLLRTLLGETFLLAGKVEMQQSTIAFCDQKSWLPNLTVQQVIVGEGEYDAVWYNTIVTACMLKRDIETFPKKDHTEIGSDGALLSGGQKQRLALARALYLRASILIFDDIFSALDRRTARAIFENLFGPEGLIKKNPKVTTILATHSLEFLQAADEVIVLQDNTVVVESSSAVLDRANVQDIGIVAENDADKSDVVEDSEESPMLLAAKKADVQQDVRETERPRRGEFQIYRFFLQSVSKWILLLWLLVIASSAFLERGTEFYMRAWVDVAPANKLLLIGLPVIGAVHFIVNFYSGWLWHVRINTVLATSLHDLFITSLMDATLTYLTSTNSGFLLNRSSQDMTLLSQRLPAGFQLTVYITFMAIADTVMIATAATYAALAIPFMLVVIYFLQLFYLRTSRQMRHLDLEQKTPLYTKLTETASGVEHIRAFGWEERTLQESYRLLDESQKAVFYMYGIQRWLVFVLDSTILVIAVALVAMAVFWTATVSQPSLGLGLLATMNWNLVLVQWVQYWTLLETSLGAAQRLRSFVEDTPHEEDKPGLTNVADWPRKGDIEFRNVTAKYNENAEAKALDNLSFKVSAGTTVGISGRTGSGKSSCLLTLLRLISYEGSITIDGIDIKDVPRQQLRQSLITITQEALHLPGTVRENLIPQDLGKDNVEDHDEEIKSTLKKVELLDHVNSRGGLDKDFDDMDFSEGQRQLFSLARALLQRYIIGSKILLIDEATSNVDYESDARMQTILREAFNGCTRLIIAHRVQTIADSDVLMELADGKVLSFVEKTET